MNREREAPVISGILNIDKPQGWTSHDVVAKVRRLTGQKRVGHAGTLDPLATGVLLVCLGQATRVVEYLMDGRKVYHATIHLGVSTDTYDSQGQVTHTTPHLTVTRSQVEEALSVFVGRIEQVPPAYSALKHKGTPLYKLARRGQAVRARPRTIEIHGLRLTAWDPPRLEVEVTCSRGTYIRSLAHDLGQKLGCGAHLCGLVRLASGRFTLEEAISLEALAEVAAQGNWAEVLLPIDAALQDMAAVTVNAEDEKRIRFGRQVGGAGFPTASEHLCRAYSGDGQLIALLAHDPQTGLWQPKKVFAPKSHATD